MKTRSNEGRIFQQYYIVLFDDRDYVNGGGRDFSTQSRGGGFGDYGKFLHDIFYRTGVPKYDKENVKSTLNVIYHLRFQTTFQAQKHGCAQFLSVTCSVKSFSKTFLVFRGNHLQPLKLNVCLVYTKTRKHFQRHGDQYRKV